MKIFKFCALAMGGVLALVTHTAVADGRKLEAESAVVTKHSITVRGKQFSYTATAGTQPVWDKDGEVIASLFYTYYQRDNIRDREHRPLIFSFNGGPGSASVWMHIAYTGPRILNVDDEGFPVQPYGVRENPYSILDVADIVFINPVNTGYSRMIDASDDAGEDKGGGKVDDKAKREIFFGVNADIEYLAEWLNTFVTRNNRWLSPKYLIGEAKRPVDVSERRYPGIADRARYRAGWAGQIGKPLAVFHCCGLVSESAERHSSAAGPGGYTAAGGGFCHQ
jgi:hypothetical protein